MSRARKAKERYCRINQLSNQEYKCFQITSADVKNTDNCASTERIPFREILKNMWLVITNKADTHGNMTLGAFAIMVSIAFRAVALIGFCIFVLGIIAMVLNVYQMSWSNWIEGIKNVYAITLVVMILLMIGLYSLVMWGASNEMRKERDKNYIVSVFSGVVSFAALIVALVALVKG